MGLMSGSFAGSWSALGIHQQVVRVGGAVGWAAALLIFLVGVSARDPDVMLSAVGPAGAAAFMTAQALMRRERAGVAMFGASVIIAVIHSVLGVSGAGTPLSVALVVITALAAMLVDRHRVLAVGLPAAALLILPQAWELPAVVAVQTGVVNAVAFVVASVVFIAIRREVSQYSGRYRALFDDSPAAVLEEDWTEAVEHLRSEYDGRPERIERFLLAYPTVLRAAMDKARVVRANPAAVQLLEAPSEEELLGYRNGDRVSDINLEAWAAILGALYRGEKTYGIDIATQTRKGRSIWVQVRGADSDPTRPSSSILVGLADVTHNRARSEAMAELVRAKNDFIAQVSHELRTPLTAVVGLAAELESGHDLDPEERAELTGLMAAQAREVAGIVEDLLVAARTELGSMTVETRVVHLGEEVEATVHGLGMKLAGTEDAFPHVIADPGRVRQIIRNLLTNANRYGGPNVRVRAGVVSGKAWLEVRDDGDGVPAGLGEAIFQPYKGSGSRPGESVGIGLSVSRQLAELMGGSLGYARDGSETVFRLVLPAATVSPARALASQAADA